VTAAASASDVRFAPSGFFALRTPLLPISALHGWSAELTGRGASCNDDRLEQLLAADTARLIERLRTACEAPEVAEAIFLASPDLDSAVRSWLRGSRQERSHALALVQGLARYFVRMAARPTPFGLLAGCSVGFAADRTALMLGPRCDYRRHARLDMHYVTSVAEELERDPGLRAALEQRPNPDLYRFAGELRYAERSTDPTTRARTYELVGASASDALDALLDRAASGAGPAELSRALVEAGYADGHEEAAGFVDEAIDSQLLTAELAPSVTGRDPLSELCDALRARVSAGSGWAQLQNARHALAALDAEPLGVPPARYQAIAEGLRGLPVEPRLDRLFHVDLHKPAAAAAVGPVPLRELVRAVNAIARLRLHEESEDLRTFRQAFTERYDSRLESTLPLHERVGIPLLEVLDGESGIGFGEGCSVDAHPLLDGLAFPLDAPVSRFGEIEKHLLRALVRCQRAADGEWNLDERDLQVLCGGDALLPDAFSVTATLVGSSAAAVDEGAFRWVVRAVQGPSGATRLARFCHGDPALTPLVEGHLRHEESLRGDAIFMEIVHLPDGRDGNLMCRPVFGRRELGYLGRSGAPASEQIQLADLRLTFLDGRIVLFSASQGREVVPRLTSSHNPERSPLPIYRFLCSLQSGRESRQLGWSWGCLDSSPFLPRVCLGKVVLAVAQWTLDAADLAPLQRGSTIERFRAAQSLRRRHRLPRWIGLAEGDNVLPIDLDNVLSVAEFAHRSRQTGEVKLTELFLDEDELVVTSPEGKYTNELVIPFERQSSTAKPPPAASPRGQQPTASSKATSTFAPGSEWLYAKLYTGTRTVDALLTQVVVPLVCNLRARGELTRWFFIRYGDPQWHLRVRLHGRAERLSALVLPALHEAVDPWLRDGRIQKLQLDTYEREVGKYGGDHAIPHAEAIFEADSDAVLSLVGQLEADGDEDARWRIALCGVHWLMVDLGLDCERRLAVVLSKRDRYGHELGVGRDLLVAMGQRFRRERALLERSLASAPRPEFAHRSAAVGPAARALDDLERTGCLRGSMEGLASSLVHMHCNRLLRSDHRPQEVVLYDFLARLYRSELARARRCRERDAP
jgi:lantibiotic biosynthesis protein